MSRQRELIARVCWLCRCTPDEAQDIPLGMIRDLMRVADEMKGGD